MRCLTASQNAWSGSGVKGAGAEGFEPPFSGLESDVLGQLDDTPRVFGEV